MELVHPDDTANILALVAQGWVLLLVVQAVHVLVVEVSIHNLADAGVANKHRKGVADHAGVVAGVVVVAAMKVVHIVVEVLAAVLVEEHPAEAHIHLVVVKADSRNLEVPKSLPAAD